MFDDVLVFVDTPEGAAIWVNEFGVSLPALIMVLRRVGPRYNDIREELGGAHDCERHVSEKMIW